MQTSICQGSKGHRQGHRGPTSEMDIRRFDNGLRVLEISGEMLCASP